MEADSENNGIEEKRAELDRLLYGFFGRPNYVAIAAICSAVGVIYVFLYECGIASYYGYPLEAIAIVPERFLQILVSMVYTFVVMFVATEFTLKLKEKWTLKELAIWAQPIPIILIALAITGLYFPHLKDKNVTGIWLFTVIYVLIHFVVPQIRYRKTRGFIERMLAEDRKEGRELSIAKGINAAVGFVGNLAYLFLILSAFLVYQAGVSSALKKSEYYVSADDAKIVQLREFGNVQILGVLDEDRSSIQRVMKVYVDSEIVNGGFVLTPMRIAGGHQNVESDESAGVTSDDDSSEP